MISGSKPKGFTIVETMIFLAVSMALLASAMLLISGSQNKAQFKVAMNDVQEQLTRIVNNVANGYYPSVTTGGCTSNGSGSLSFSGLPQVKGTNQNCSFIGRVVQFSAGDTFEVYSIAGLRKTNTPLKSEVSNMNEAQATALPGPEVVQLKNGIRVSKVIDGSRTPQEIGAVGFFTGFGNTTADGLQSGGLQSEFIGVIGSTLTSDASLVSGSTFRNDYANPAHKNPPSGIEICFNSGTTAQHGIITIGGQNKSAVTTLRIVEGVCP